MQAGGELNNQPVFWMMYLAGKHRISDQVGVNLWRVSINEYTEPIEDIH